MKPFQTLIIPSDAVPMWWPQIEALLMKCPETWQEYETLDSIYSGLMNGVAHVAVVLEGMSTKVLFAGMFQVRNYAATRSIFIYWGSGSGIQEYTKLFLDTLESFAVRVGASFVEMNNVRPGLAKAIIPYGYEAPRMNLRKKVEQRTIQ